MRQWLSPLFLASLGLHTIQLFDEYLVGFVLLLKKCTYIYTRFSRMAKRKENREREREMPAVAPGLLEDTHINSKQARRNKQAYGLHRRRQQPAIIRWMATLCQMSLRRPGDGVAQRGSSNSELALLCGFAYLGEHSPCALL